MSGSDRSRGEFFRTLALPRRATGRVVHGGFLTCCTTAALLGSAGGARSGPCTAQIAQLERQIKQMPPGRQTGPTWSQTLGAQRHNQPTPRDVEHAQSEAARQAGAELDHARQADAAGNADECNAALTRVRRLYDIN